MTTLIRYILDVKHDDGWLTIETMATGEEAARRAVMAAESCPERAIRRVRAVEDATGYELRADLKGYRQLAVGDIRKDFSKNSQSRPDKVPMPWQVQVLDEPRWRRVYATRNTGAYYIMLDGLKVHVKLPEVLP